MRIRIVILAAVMLVPAWSECTPGRQVEPAAGSWRTWVIPSGREFRVPPPPDPGATQEELAWLKKFVTTNDAIASDQIRYWNSGPSSFRWMDLIANKTLNGQIAGTVPTRAWTYVSLAMYDATIAAWESKYFYNRPRPSATDPSIRPRLETPCSPSYPSDYAATAAAAAEVLAYLLPNEAAALRGLAEEAGRSRLSAGLEYPSDYFAGLDLGRRVAAQVIAKARSDGYDTVWNGAVPTGACMWMGTNPGGVTAPNWRTLVLTSPGEFRPPAPPSCTSPEMQAQLVQVRDFPRNTAAFTTNAKAMYYQSVDGNNLPFFQFLSRFLLEDHLEFNPPRAVRAYALLGVAAWDSYIAAQDGKFAYWYLRPNMLDPSVTTLFATPNFPSYPANHATNSTTRAEIVAYLFPDRADQMRAVAKEAGDSRIWAGIHYQIDLDSGVQLGRKVAQKVIDWANRDGSQ